MLKKFALAAAVWTAAAAGSACVYAYEGMTPSIARESTAVDGALAWTVPAGWNEVPATGMRMGSFVSAGKPDAIDVSIISLGPAAGDLDSNLQRWAGQIEAPADAASIQKLIAGAAAVKTELDPEVKIFDFSVLQGGRDASAKSMITSIIRTEGAVVFVKMTGTLESAAANKDAFKALVASIRKK